MKISVSIVDYFCNDTLLRETISTLARASHCAHEIGLLESIELDFIDNSPAGTRLNHLKQLFAPFERPTFKLRRVYSGHGNVGFGSGHNLSISEITSDFHLVVNPDLAFSEDSLINGIRHFKDHLNVGMIAPRISNDSGQLDCRCYRYPTVLTLFLRGFAPHFMKRAFARRLAQYTFEDMDWNSTQTHIPIVSGCFMFFKSEILRKIQGFDSSFFLYFEDFDISIRTSRLSEIHYVPSVKVVHFGGHASQKGFKHIKMFATSAFKFFNKHGWRIV